MESDDGKLFKELDFFMKHINNTKHIHSVSKIINNNKKERDTPKKKST